MTRLLECEDGGRATESHTEEVDQKEEGDYGEDMTVRGKREGEERRRESEPLTVGESRD